MKRTPWFSCKTPPVRPGWYDAAYGGKWRGVRRWFDGTKWRVKAGSRHMADFGPTWDGDQWRGLTEPAK